MTDSLEDVLKKAEENVNRSGFSVELHIHSLLNKNNYLVYSSDYFFDYDMNKSRSIDLAVKAMEVTATSSTVEIPPIHVEMDIECKKSEKNVWIFFIAKSIIESQNSGQIIDYKQRLTKKYEDSCLLWDIDRNLNLHYGREWSMSPIAVSYSAVKKCSDRQENEKDEIFEGVNQVLKYIAYHSELEIAEYKDHDPVIAAAYPLFFLYYPVIVFDGILCSGRLTDGQIKLEEENHIILKAQYKPRYSIKEKTFYIDIVRKEYFGEFLKNIEEECKNLTAVVKKHSERMFDDANKLYLMHRESI